MSETASFVDPVFLARFGLCVPLNVESQLQVSSSERPSLTFPNVIPLFCLCPMLLEHRSRANVLDYFLHPLNPFRTQANTSNEVLAMQGIAIGMLMQYGLQGSPLSPQAAEEEYRNALGRLTGEQYELLPPVDPAMYAQPSPLYTLRHVQRQSSSKVTILGVYYVVEGVIYKAPAVRSLMKTNVARVLDEGLSGACQALSDCARYHPSLGYLWVFEDDHDLVDPVSLIQLSKRRKRRKILDNRKPGERTAAEEEGIRASEALDQILVRLSKSSWLTKTGPGSDPPTTRST